MKSKVLFTILLASTIFFAFGFSGDKTEKQLVNNIVLMFEGTNGNGNNLWLDNFSIGTRYNNDLTITSIGLRDRNYLLPGVTTTNVTPVITIFNAGWNTYSTGATITMTDAGSYNVTRNVPGLSGGYTTTIAFDPITFNQSTTKNLSIHQLLGEAK